MTASLLTAADVVALLQLPPVSLFLLLLLCLFVVIFYRGAGAEALEPSSPSFAFSRTAIYVHERRAQTRIPRERFPLARLVAVAHPRGAQVVAAGVAAPPAAAVDSPTVFGFADL